MKSGMIYLYRKEDELISIREYKVKSERDDIIKSWRKIYGEGFYKCFIHILPNFGDGIKMNGKNKQVHKFRNRKRDYKNEFTEPII